MDITHLKTVIGFGIELGNAVGKSLEDNKLSFEDVANFMGAFSKISAVMESFKFVSSELKDLDAAEMQSLKDQFIADFNLSNDEIESKIEKGLSLALSLYEFVKDLAPKEKPAPEEPVVEG